MKKIIVLLTIILVLACCTVSVFAMTEQEVDVYNNLYYPLSIYNEGIYKVDQKSNANKYVDPATGSTHIKVTDLSLPGVNGFDLNITRMYSSTNASMFEAYLKETEKTYEKEYFMVKGYRQEYKYYTNGTWEYINSSDICLTPDFMDYINTKSANWMLQNQDDYTYNYTDNPSISKLFISSREAKEVVDFLNETTNEIKSVGNPYDNVATYNIDYYNFKVVAVLKDESYIEYADGLLGDTVTERYSKLGLGWEFTFPYIEIRYGYEDSWEYLHFGDKGTWLIDFSDGGENNLSGYPLNDIKLVEDTSVAHDNIKSKYRLDEKNGTSHYFGSDGRLLLQQDRYGNQIKFYCETEEYRNVWDKVKHYPYIKKIVDTMGREVIFTLESDTCPEIKYVYMTITDPADTNNSKAFCYILNKVSDAEIGITSYDECSDIYVDEWILSEVVDSEETSGCSYIYNYMQTKFSFLDRNGQFYYNYGRTEAASARDRTRGNTYVYTEGTNENFDEFNGIHNTYALISRVVHQREGEKRFCYAPFVKNCGSAGSMMFYKAFSSCEQRYMSYDGGGGYENSEIYTYDINNEMEYDGFANHNSINGINDTKIYEVDVTDSNGSYERYQYKYLGSKDNKAMLLTKHTAIGADHNVETLYSYDTNTKLTTSVEVNNYSVDDLSQYMTQSNSYTYDSNNYGDLLTETPNGNEDRTVSYIYDSTYHFPVSEIYKQDADTTIRKEYIPTSDGKSIEYIKVFVNDVLKNKTWYNHDSYGNIVNERNYINESDYVENVYTYQDGAYVVLQTVKQVEDIDGNKTDVTVSSAYDYWGNRISLTDSNGNTTQYEYDLENRPVKIINPDGSSKQYKYAKNYTREEDELGNRITYYLNNPADRVGRIYYGFVSENNSQFYYSRFGQIETEIMYKKVDGNHQELNRTEYTYDTLQRPVSKNVYDGNNILLYTETYSYEITNQYQKQTTTVVGDENTPSVVTSKYIDNFGNVIKTQNGSDYETYTFDYVGNILSVKSARANSENWEEAFTETTEYDYLGNTIKQTDVLGNYVRAEYDTLGRMIKSYDVNGNMSEFKYDALGRIIEQKNPVAEQDGTVYYSVKQVWYDNNGNVIKEKVNTNAPGEDETYSITEYSYDNRNRLVETKMSDGTTYNYTQYYYDVKGNLLRVYTGLNSPLSINGLDDITPGSDTDYAVTKYTYDALGDVLTVTDALGNTETNTYDAVSGLLLNSTDRNGQTVFFAYDGFGHIVSKSFVNGTNAETSVYGATGQLVSLENNTTTLRYFYDNKGRLVTETDSGLGTAKTYTYDSAGNRLTFTLTRSGEIEINQSYVYDELNRLVSVSENDTVIATYTYDNAGNRTQTTVPGGKTTSYTYNIANLLTSQTTQDILTEQYSYYLNGNQKSKTSNGITTNYVYDSMNRLVRVNGTQYTFDDFSNRLTMSDGTNSTSYFYDLNNRLKESVEVTGEETKTTRYYYDNNGNTVSHAVMVNHPYEEGTKGNYNLSASTNENIVLYEYDGYNRLVALDTKGVKTTYTYAPNGLRHSKNVGGTVTGFIYDNANIIEEITADETNKYYRGIEIIKNDAGLYYIYSAQGDVSFLTDTTGTMVADYVFDAYGNQSEKNMVYNPFGYRGEYTDPESGLVYLRNRYYDSRIGRFITEDPARDGMNWYVYCDNNPIKYIDPSGTVPVETIIDLASIGWSFTDFVSNPSWANFGFLAWDIAAALVPYAPGSYSAKTIKAGTQILSKSDNYVKSGVWAMKAFDRGYEIERALGGMANNFPTVDKYVKAQARAGIMWLSSVTSIKSIDITASSYKSGNTMKNVLKKYVDDLAKFKETIYKGVHYKLDSTGSKILEVAIPPVEMTYNQAKIFQEIKDYATEKGIELITRIIE